MPAETPSGPGDSPRRRRPRYSGTHPRKFEQRYKELNPDRYPQIVEHVRGQGRTPAGTHVPVLCEEVLAALAPAPGETVVDCTLGYGGHTERFLAAVGPAGTVIALDMDAAQLARADERLRALQLPGTLITKHGNFAGVQTVLGELGRDGCDVLFADLGASSMQFDDPQRGFTYKHTGPLDMRMNPASAKNATDIIRESSAESLATMLDEWADEPNAAIIAEAIIAARRITSISTTTQLADAVRSALPRARAEELNTTLARVFQALRIAVNRELESLKNLLRVAPACLRPGGRFGLLTFHSGEDRLVKHTLRDAQVAGVYSNVCDEVIRPSPIEQRENPRSRPAKFRWAVRAM